jgi:hypothetical protein
MCEAYYSENIKMNWTEWISERLGATNSPYASFIHDGLEWQFQPTDEEALLEGWLNQPYPYRIPKHGDTIPTSNDGPLGYYPGLIKAAGTSWWNWKDGLTEGCALDFDYGHGDKALDDVGIAQVDAWAERLPYVMNCTSKGGRGRHWLVRLEMPLPAQNRADHIRNCKAIMAKLSADLGVDLEKYVCSYGGIQYIYSTKVESN